MSWIEIDTNWDRDTRNAINNNFKNLYESFDGVVEKVSETAFEKVIDAAKLNWREPVDSFEDLPSSAAVGDTIMVRSTGKVYRFNGTEFIEIQQIDAGPVNELDSRLSAQLAENRYFTEDRTAVAQGGIESYWTPPGQEGAGNTAGMTAEDFKNSYFEPLRQQEPNYIKLFSKGKEQSGQYDYEYYTFTPEKYEKTVMISTCLHGNEITPMVAMSRFLKHLVEDWTNHPQLAYIRQKIRIIFIPFANPWGVSQVPRQHTNSRGVNLNRNFNYRWHETGSGEGTVNYKGTAPESEIETRYYVQIADEYKPDVILDMHNMLAPTGHYVLYTPEKGNYPTHVYRKLIDHLQRGSELVRWGISDAPTVSSYFTNVKKIPASTPEFGDQIWGGETRNAVEMYEAVRWFGNVVLRHARLQNRLVKNEPFVIFSTYTHSSAPHLSPVVGDANEDQLQEMENLTVEFDVPCDGIVLVEGHAIFDRNSEEEYTVRCQGFIEQEGGAGSRKPGTGTNPEITYVRGTRIQLLPVQTQGDIRSSDSTFWNKVRAGVRMSSDISTALLMRYRVKITFIPSQISERYMIYRATNTEPMQRWY